MKRLCVLDIPGLSRRVLAQEPGLWLNSLGGGPRPMKPVFPALWAPMQASLTTGVEPGEHGIVAGGVFRRESGQISFDERSNTLLTKKRFWLSRSLGMPKTSLVMWSQPLAGAADLVLGAMNYGPSGATLCNQPLGLYDQLADEIGPCNTSFLRGPEASWAAASWVVSAAQWIWRKHKPDLQFVYLPGLDFEIVRNGLSSPHAREALRVMDLLARRVGEFVQAQGGQIVVMSNGSYVDVGRVALPNLHLRQAGLLQLMQTDLGPTIDPANSRAVAMVDHQIAHVYCKDAAAVELADKVLRNDPAIADVVPRETMFGCGPGLERAGELIALSHRDAWMHYQWWLSHNEAPRAARSWDVPGKCGYDPCELFAPAYGSAGAGEIDPNALRVRASRGLLPEDPADWPVLTCGESIELDEPVLATAVPAILKGLMGREPLA